MAARKLAFIVKGGLHPSGREQVMPAWLALLDALAAQHEVHAFAVRHLREPASYRLRGFAVHDLGSPGRDLTAGVWREWRALRRAMAAAGPFDVVHGLWVDPGGLLAAMAGRRLGIASVVTCNSGEFVAIDDIAYGTQRTMPGRAMVRTACSLATRIHVTTTYMERLAAAHGYRAIRIPFGASLSAWTPPPSRGAGPPWRLLQVASLNPVKDQTTLLRALAMLAPRVDARLDLIGEDTLGGSLQAEAARLGIADRITFHGYTPHDALLPIYQRAHLYVQSSRHEAAGAAVLEAAACGLAIVGTRAGHVADWAPAGAIAVDPQDPGQLAAAIAQAIADDALRARLGARARAFAESHDLHWTVRQLDDLYDQITRRA